MLSQKVFRTKTERYFEWRGGDVSRLESLADAVFALSLTLLIVSLEIPATYSDMIRTFEDIPAFAVCFALLVLCWFFHYQFHRRYGLEDGITITLNAFLLFLILIFVYPLKFLFTVLFGMLLGIGSAHGRDDASLITNEQWPTLMILYSGGFVIIFLLFALLTWHAYRKRHSLELNPCEVIVTRMTIYSHLITCAVGLLSILLVLINSRWYPFSGAIYWLIGPLQGIHGYFMGKKVEAADQLTADEAQETETEKDKPDPITESRDQSVP